LSLIDLGANTRDSGFALAHMSRA